MEKKKLYPFFLAMLMSDGKTIEVITNNDQILKDIEALRKKYPEQIRPIPNEQPENILTTDIPSDWIKVQPPQRPRKSFKEMISKIWRAIQKSSLDDEERYQYTDADAPYTPEQIEEGFWNLWIF